MIQARVAIFASGRGSNAESIINYLAESDISIDLIVTNRSKAGVLDLAEKHKIKTLLIKKDEFYDSESIIDQLESEKISHIILAGFLLKIPDYLIKAFPEKILNIHPALLPKYGGKGMYGHHVHQAVYDNKENESGITIHLVNENYDEGKIIFQASCAILNGDEPDDIARKVLELEHFHFPRVVENWIAEPSLDS